MIREIVQLGDKVLRETCAPVEKFDEELASLLDDMKETLKKAQGAGLAAHPGGAAHHALFLPRGQLGVSKLLVVPGEAQHVPAHQLPVGMGVKIGQGQLLGVFEQILPDPSHDFLAGDHHELVVAQRGERARSVHKRHQHDGPYEARNVAGQDIVVDHGL